MRRCHPNQITWVDIRIPGKDRPRYPEPLQLKFHNSFLSGVPCRSLAAFDKSSMEGENRMIKQSWPGTLLTGVSMKPCGYIDWVSNVGNNLTVALPSMDMMNSKTVSPYYTSLFTPSLLEPPVERGPLH